jgi:hypothetical protein
VYYSGAHTDTALLPLLSLVSLSIPIGCRDGTSVYPFSRVAILNPKRQFFRPSLASYPPTSAAPRWAQQLCRQAERRQRTTGAADQSRYPKSKQPTLCVAGCPTTRLRKKGSWRWSPRFSDTQGTCKALAGRRHHTVSSQLTRLLNCPQWERLPLFKAGIPVINKIQSSVATGAHEWLVFSEHQSVE